MVNFILILLFFNAFFLFILVLNTYKNKQDKENQEEETKVLRVNTRSIEINKENNSVKFFKRHVNSLDHCEELEMSVSKLESSDNRSNEEQDLTDKEFLKELDDELSSNNSYGPFTDEDYHVTPTLDDIHNISNYQNTEKDVLIRSLSKCVGTEFFELLKKDLPELESLLDNVDSPDCINYSHTEKDVRVRSNVSGRKFIDIEKLKERSLED